MPEVGRLFSENATCGEYSNTKQSFSDKADLMNKILKESREIWFSTEGEKIRKAIDGHYLFGESIENEAKKR